LKISKSNINLETTGINKKKNVKLKGNTNCVLDAIRSKRFVYLFWYAIRVYPEPVLLLMMKLFGIWMRCNCILKLVDVRINFRLNSLNFILTTADKIILRYRETNAFDKIFPKTHFTIY
ncbi:FLYWCH-type domain-containing protein, partial [Aphis craccivora]